MKTLLEIFKEKGLLEKVILDNNGLKIYKDDSNTGKIVINKKEVKNEKDNRFYEWR
jgi:dihydroorotase